MLPFYTTALGLRSGMSVPARISLVTLGVADLVRATAFYEGLGWPLSPASVPGEVSFFNTAGGLLGLYGHAALADDAGLAPDVPVPFRGVALAINLEDRHQVDAALLVAVTAGGTLVKAGQPTEWGGYNGYFADPDGHLWEVAHNPGWPIGPDQRPILP
jgi:catechol 2,3-dioxygenase-like lactoylglutathione lyase family enzyme